MGFDVDRNVGLLAEPSPALNQRKAILQPSRPDIGLKIDVADAELGCDVENRLEIVDRLREGLPFNRHVSVAENADNTADTVAVRTMRADAAETGLDDHREIFFQRPLDSIRVSALHGPE
jgi:hypothetical protein